MSSSTIVASISALQALDPSSNPVAYLTVAGREGEFVWRTGDYSARVSADAYQGVFIASNIYGTTTGAWVRAFDGDVHASWFGALGDYLTSGADRAPAITSALALAVAYFNGRVLLSAGVYGVASQITVPRYGHLVGPGFHIGARWDTVNSTWVFGAGATLAITYGSGSTTRTSAAVTVTTGSTVEGIGFYYPNQSMAGSASSTPYPATIACLADSQGPSNRVTTAQLRDLYVTNAYNFVDFSINHGQCNFENIQGTCLNIGFNIDQSFDVDRFVDIHFNPNNAYLADWPAVGVWQKQLANTSSAFMQLATADQAYINRCFSYGSYYGLHIVNTSGRGPNGLGCKMSGFEGCILPIKIEAVCQGSVYENLVLGTITDISGITGSRCIQLSAPDYCRNLIFQNLSCFAAVGPAMEIYKVKGLIIENVIIDRTLNSDTFARGAIEVYNSSRVTIRKNQIRSADTLITYLIMNYVSGFTVADNFLQGMNNSNGSPFFLGNCSYGTISNNLQSTASVSLATVGQNANTNVSAANIGSYVE